MHSGTVQQEQGMHMLEDEWPLFVDFRRTSLPWSQRRPKSQLFFKDVVPDGMISNGRKTSESPGVHFVFFVPSSNPTSNENI